MAERDKKRKDERKAVSLLVQMKFPDLGVFTEKFATNISQGGMFLFSRTPPPAGTVVNFEIQIAGGVRAMRGTGVVSWVRHQAGRAGVPGMGLQFTELDAATQALVEQMLAHKQPGAAGGTGALRPSGPAIERTAAPAAASTPELPDELDWSDSSADKPASTAAAPPVPLASLIDEALCSNAAGPATPPPPPPDAAREDFAEAPDSEIEAEEVEEVEEVDEADEAAVNPSAPPAEPPQLRTVFLKAVKQPGREGPVIGIDLGTTNCCVAVLEEGKPRVLRSRDGYTTIPSVVSISPQGRLLVGQRAKSQLLLNPASTVHGAKRLVGLAFDSATVRQIRDRFHFPICADERRLAAVRLGSAVVTLEEIQGILLRECKDLAEVELGTKVERAVVTVPAYYSEPQRQAVRRAGALAGLEVERTVNEPTAAALAYGLNREFSKTVLVYDLGGGTFDATVLRIEDNVFEVLATGGDTFLGGVDFDHAVMDFLFDRFRETEGIAFSGDPIAASRVADAAEQAKIALSSKDTHEVQVPLLMIDAKGKPRDLRHLLTRAELQGVCASLVDRTLEVVNEVLAGAKLEMKDLDEVLIVGGQSRMPYVRERLEARLGRPVQAKVHADEAVAQGAALLSGSLDKVGSVVLIDVLPMTIGVGLPGGKYQRLLERNTVLPARRTVAVTTRKDDEQSIDVSLFQGEDDHISGNEYLGTVRVLGLPKAPKGKVKVAVTVRLDGDCVVHVEARDLATKQSLGADFSSLYSAEELQQRLKLKPAAIQSAEERRGKRLLERAGRFWALLRRSVG